MKRTKLPKVVLGRKMLGDAPTEHDPKITFELEAETGDIFEIGFSLRGILSTVVMANNCSFERGARGDAATDRAQRRLGTARAAAAEAAQFG